MSIIQLYGPEFSYYLRSMRLLLNYKQISHEVTYAPFGETIPPFSDGHESLHPFRKLPVYIEGEVVIPETPAIAWYVEQKPGPSFIPGDASVQAQVLSKASLATCYVHKAIMAGILLEFRFPKGPDGTVRMDVVEQNVPEAKRVLAWLEQELAGNNYWVAHQFTLADAYLIPMLDYLSQAPAPFDLLEPFEACKRYVQFHQKQSYSEGVLGKG